MGIQLDHYSLTVPPPLCLTFFWMQCGDDSEKILDAKQSLQKCYNIFYTTQVVADANVEIQRPLGLMRTIYEQRIRRVNASQFADNVQSAKSLFSEMFQNDQWMEKDKPIKPKETRADKVFSALKEEEEKKEDADIGKDDKSKEEEKITESEPKNESNAADMQQKSAENIEFVSK